MLNLPQLCRNLSVFYICLGSIFTVARKKSWINWVLVAAAPNCIALSLALVVVTLLLLLHYGIAPTSGMSVCKYRATFNRDDKKKFMLINTVFFSTTCNTSTLHSRVVLMKICRKKALAIMLNGFLTRMNRNLVYLFIIKMRIALNYINHHWMPRLKA